MRLNKRKRPGSEAPRKRSRRGGDPSKTTDFFESSQVVKLALFFGFSALVALICFVGLKESLPPVVEGQRAQSRVVAEFTYSYESDLATREKIREARTKVPPVYRLSLSPYRVFSEYLEDLKEGLQVLALQLEGMNQDDREEALGNYSKAVRSPEGFRITPEQADVLLRRTTPEQRARLFDEGLAILRDIYERGIYEPAEPGFVGNPSQMRYLTIIDASGKPTQVEVQPLAEATFELNQRLRALGSAPVARALFGLFRTGMEPNLVYDLQATEESIRLAELSVSPVMVTVYEGDTILAPGSVITPEDQEKLLAYNEALSSQRGNRFTFDNVLLQQFLLSLGITFAAALYIRVSGFNLGRQNRRLALSITAVLLNLGIIRLVLEIGESNLFATNPGFLAILPYIAPSSLAALIISLLINPRLAVLGALVVSLFFALMQGGAFEHLFITFLSSLVAIYFSTDVRKRGTVVKAGFFAGLTVAVCAAFIGLLNEVDLPIIARQVGFSLLAGAITGVIVVGLLPVLENSFKITTEITLLELTDFNHPLLRRMQVEAPGSYHHSLMVANLAENAAAAIGANSLICRTCALFHDIGKLVKPEYFTENQRGGINPHLAQNPSMSALVIKAHVKEGVQLAREYRLPRIIIDVIREHHGTSLIQYFYYEALKKRRNLTGGGGTVAPFPEAPTIKAEEVDESTYRYDGPKPSFPESAVVFFADSVEAASRSLKKVSPLAIDELLDRIFQDRLEDRQLDDCPITFQEITQIKKSFSFTLLNMLHSRVEYPRKDEEEAENHDEDPDSEKPQPKTEAPNPQEDEPKDPKSANA